MVAGSATTLITHVAATGHVGHGTTFLLRPESRRLDPACSPGLTTFGCVAAGRPTTAKKRKIHMRPLQRLTHRARPYRDPELADYLEQTFPTADAVILCSFGVDQHGERSIRELQRALLDAGFALQTTGHLIRSSPLLYRSGRRRYTIGAFRR